MDWIRAASTAKKSKKSPSKSSNKGEEEQGEKRKKNPRRRVESFSRGSFAADDQGRKAPDRRKALDRTRSGRDSMRDLMAMQKSGSKRNLIKPEQGEEKTKENDGASRSPRRALSRSMSGRNSLRDLMALQRAASVKDLQSDADDGGDKDDTTGTSSSGPRPAPLQRRDNLRQTKCPSTRFLQETTKDSEDAYERIVDDYESGDDGIVRSKRRSPSMKKSIATKAENASPHSGTVSPRRGSAARSLSGLLDDYQQIESLSTENDK
mmetsp:Transcript_7380/g.16318  ORF Transcript_7380/g.16318 Transcript_7380/m.16318 type:complete len:265 (-) Transcript_7380:153-947(-)